MSKAKEVLLFELDEQPHQIINSDMGFIRVIDEISSMAARGVEAQVQ